MKIPAPFAVTRLAKLVAPAALAALALMLVLAGCGLRSKAAQSTPRASRCQGRALRHRHISGVPARISRAKRLSYHPKSLAELPRCSLRWVSTCARRCTVHAGVQGLRRTGPAGAGCSGQRQGESHPHQRLLSLLQLIQAQAAVKQAQLQYNDANTSTPGRRSCTTTAPLHGSSWTASSQKWTPRELR